MPKLLFLAFVYLFGCLLNQELSIRAHENPVKRVVKGKNSVNQRFFYLRMENYFFDLKSQKSTRPDLCGAVIISERYVLSAGHCVHEPFRVFQKSELIFYDFRFNHSAPDTPKVDETIIVGPSEVFVFRRTGSGYFVPDFAVVEMEPFFYKQFRIGSPLPICSKDLFRRARHHGLQVSVVGMGETQFNISKSVSRILQEATMEVTQSQNPCKYYYEHGKYRNTDVLCAVGVSCFPFFGSPRKLAYVNEKNVCFGDSGGPLFHKYEDGTAECVIGIVNGNFRKWGHRTLIEKLSPFHDGSGDAGYFSSLELFWDRWSKKEELFDDMEFWNGKEIVKETERREELSLPPLS